MQKYGAWIMEPKIRIKYYLKLILSLALSACIAAAAVYGLVHDELALRGEAAAVYESLAVPAEAVVLDLNTASERALQKISGIGETTARAIVEYREEHGNFVSVDELLNVRGIGQATLERIRPYLKV